MKRYGISRNELVELAADVVRRGGCLTFRAHGPSMSPCVQDGEQVTVGPLGEGGVRRGDLVLARTSRGPRLHRVVSMGRDSEGAFYTLRGDTDILPSLAVRQADFIGRVVAVHHSPRRLLSPRRLAHAVLGSLRRLAEVGTVVSRCDDDIYIGKGRLDALVRAGVVLCRAGLPRLPVDLE